MKIKHTLSYALFLAVLGLSPGYSAAQEAAEKAPEAAPTAVEAPAPTNQPPVIIELFTSQACLFCPKADTLMGELIKQPGVIGLSCHIDYFDVKAGSLSHPFCTSRQQDYISLLQAGALYTPQMVINGHKDVVGYRTDEVGAAIREARTKPLKAIGIEKQGSDAYSFSLGEMNFKIDATEEGLEPPVRLWMAVFDKPHELTVAEGGNKGKKMTYYNVVSDIVDLGAWDGAALARAVTPKLSDQNAGLVIAAQDVTSGEIIAAGVIYLE